METANSVAFFIEIAIGGLCAILMVEAMDIRTADRLIADAITTLGEVPA